MSKKAKPTPANSYFLPGERAVTEPAGGSTVIHARRTPDSIGQTENGEGSGKHWIMFPHVISWGLWDWAGAAFNSVVTTFVFSVYLVKAPGFGSHANTALGYVLAAAGLMIALSAPTLGQSVDRSGRRATVLRITTLTVSLVTALMFFVSPGQWQLWLGLLLLAVGNIAFEIGSVVYNSILTDIAPRKDFGKISGFGWGMGYIGGIVLLLILFVGFIQPEVGWFGVTSENGLNIRFAVLIAAIWSFVFSLPLIVTLRDVSPTTDETPSGIREAYREVWSSLRRIWDEDRSLVWFLISSAIYRDGLAGVFTFGAILAGAAFGFGEGEIIIFGVAANIIAGIATIAFGYLDDILGARRVIIFSVAAMSVIGILIFVFHKGVFGYSPHTVYWALGLALCVFVGPTQSASRTYLARIAPPGEEGEMFGLYATTGRAVSFLAPFLYSTAITLGAALTGIALKDAAYFGILGIVFTLALGLFTFIPVKPQEHSE
ncbi:MFS transporter [Arcanobacterium canis]